MATLRVTVIVALISWITDALNPNVPPSDNFDLSHWRLQWLPINNSTTCGTIETSELMAGYESQWFYTDKTDGSMTFYMVSTLAASGCTTSGSHDARSELREDCDPKNSSLTNWRITDGEYILNGTYRIDKNITAETAIIQQVKGVNGQLIKTSFRNINGDGQIWVQYNDGKNTEIASVGFDIFNLLTIVNKGNIKIYVNGAQKFNVNVTNWNSCVYFKSGNYLQDAANDPEYIKVHVYQLDQILKGPCTPNSSC